MVKKAYAWVGEIFYTKLPEDLPHLGKYVCGGFGDLGNVGLLAYYLDRLGVRRESAGVIAYHPTKADICTAIKDPDMVLYVSNSHSADYASKAMWTRLRGAPDDEQLKSSGDAPNDVHTAMSYRNTAVKFSLLIACESMTKTDEGTFSRELTKGWIINTAAIGLKNAAAMPEDNWFPNFHPIWMTIFLALVGARFTFHRAFSVANSAVRPLEPYMAFFGDEHLRQKDLWT